MILNFTKRFADDVEHARKTQTFRVDRADNYVAKIDETLYLWTGLRTKGARPLGHGTCTFSAPTLISKHGIYLAGRTLSVREAEEFAKLDGFSDPRDMCFFLFGVHDPKGSYGIDKLKGNTYRWTHRKIKKAKQ